VACQLSLTRCAQSWPRSTSASCGPGNAPSVQLNITRLAVSRKERPTTEVPSARRQISGTERSVEASRSSARQRTSSRVMASPSSESACSAGSSTVYACSRKSSSSLSVACAAAAATVVGSAGRQPEKLLKMRAQNGSARAMSWPTTRPILVSYSPVRTNTRSPTRCRISRVACSPGNVCPDWLTTSTMASRNAAAAPALVSGKPVGATSMSTPNICASLLALTACAATLGSARARSATNCSASQRLVSTPTTSTSTSRSRCDALSAIFSSSMRAKAVALSRHRLSGRCHSSRTRASTAGMASMSAPTGSLRAAPDSSGSGCTSGLLRSGTRRERSSAGASSRFSRMR
jgi:hypothetical protein